MNAAPGDPTPAPLAPRLNADCQCLWLDRARLESRLAGADGEIATSFLARPGLASGSVVFVDPRQVEAMDRTAALVERALDSAAFERRILATADPVARLDRPWRGALLGYDFHLGEESPQLIEINTNPGGLLVNLELARAMVACCDELAGPAQRWALGDLAPAAVEARILEGFLAEWRQIHGTRSPENVAIADDDPHSQYLYPEFLLYRRLFEHAGWRAAVVDVSAFEHRDGALWSAGERVDLVYNRSTDFMLAEPRHAALRAAYESGTAWITPHPAVHARRADKRLLAWLGEEALLADAGLADDERRHLRATLPHTEVVTPEAADSLWRRRKGLFFKPAAGFGSKAAYRGDKLTRTAFEHVLAHPYVAQDLAPTSTRRVVAPDGVTELRVDLRNYRQAGATLLRAARLYRGQTTNFRTPGGGFAPVLVVPA
jgi:hypothetical protein